MDTPNGNNGTVTINAKLFINNEFHDLVNVVPTMGRDLEYEQENIAYDEQNPREIGGGIKCKNYVMCEGVLPTWWYECKGKYLCTNCDILLWSIKSPTFRNTYYIRRVSDGQYLTVHGNKKHVFWRDTTEGEREHFYFETIDKIQRVLVSKTNNTLVRYKEYEHEEDKLWQSVDVEIEKQECGDTFNAAVYARIVYEKKAPDVLPDVSPDVSADAQGSQPPVVPS